MGTKTGLNGITFGDATVQNTAAVTGVTSAVAGTGVSVSAATGAVTFTNSGVTSIVAGSGISISGGTGAVTVTNSAQGATYSAGNGLGLSGTTFSVAAPTFNTVGSYVFGVSNGNPNGTTSLQGGSNYSAGNGYNQIMSGGVTNYGSQFNFNWTNNLSGSWKCMGYSGDPRDMGGTMFVRVA